MTSLGIGVANQILKHFVRVRLSNNTAKSGVIPVEKWAPNIR